MHAQYDQPQEVLAIAISNVGSSARHHVSMTIQGLMQFSGVALGPLTQATTSAEVWRTPQFDESNGEIRFPPLEIMGGVSSLRVFVWGKFKVFGPHIDVSSDDGPGALVPEELVGGWPLVIASNISWFTILLLTIWWLGLFFRHKRRKS